MAEEREQHVVVRRDELDRDGGPNRVDGECVRQRWGGDEVGERRGGVVSERPVRPEQVRRGGCDAEHRPRDRRRPMVHGGTIVERDEDGTNRLLARAGYLFRHYALAGVSGRLHPEKPRVAPVEAPPLLVGALLRDTPVLV